MHPYQQHLDTALSLHKESKFAEAENIYQQLLNRMPFDEALLYLLGDLYLRREWNGLAINLLSALLQNNPKHDAAWVNLGCAFRKENEYEKAKAAWQKALQLSGETPQLCHNFSGLYADRGSPQMALAWIEKGLKLEPDNVDIRWSKALALLSLKQWEEGWKEYESRQGLSTWDSRPSIDVPMWDGSYVDSLYIHGEQGVGDEVMFASCLPFVKAKHITLEVNPKVATLMQKSFPYLDVVTKETHGNYDAKIPIGSLVGRYGFNTEPYLNPDPWRVKFYRDELQKLGPGPYVAVTWVGGVKQTRSEDRSILLKDLQPILDRFTCVSAQHQRDDSPHIQEALESDRIAANLPKINDESTGKDLHEQAALFRAVDAVVTVQQTAVHVAGGVGAKTYALIGSRPHWRYGVEGDSLPFYSSVKLFRRKDDWDAVVQKVLNELNADFPAVPRAEQAVA